MSARKNLAKFLESQLHGVLWDIEELSNLIKLEVIYRQTNMWRELKLEIDTKLQNLVYVQCTCTTLRKISFYKMPK